MRAVDYEEVEVTTGAAVGLDEAKIAPIAGKPEVLARIMVADASVAWLENGATPTSLTKQQIEDTGVIFLESIADMRNFLAIGLDGTAILAVTYYA